MYNAERLIRVLSALRFDPANIKEFVGELQYLEDECGVCFSEEDIIDNVLEWVEFSHPMASYVYEPEFINAHIALGPRH